MGNDEKLKEWERLARKAKKGPWYVCEADVCNKKPDDDGNGCPADCDKHVVKTIIKDNAAFIAASRTAVPELIALVRELESENARLREKVQWYSENAPFYADSKTEQDANKRIELLDKEADWLAEQCQTLSGYSPILRQGSSKNQWREVAQEAVKRAK